MNAIFKAFPLIEQSVAQRLFRQHPSENSLIELNNLLASREITDVLPQDVDGIQSKYDLDLRSEFKLNLEEFYASYLTYSLQDKTLDQQELENLHHLKSLFQLPDSVVNELHEKIGGLVYKQSFEEAVFDGRLSDEEKQFLLNLEQTLRLSRELAAKIEAEAKNNFVRSYVDTIIEDHRLSEEEELELRAIASSLGLDLPPDSESQKRLQQLKLYWVLENMELPVISGDLKLQKQENCHLQVNDVRWYKVSGRNRTVINSYSNPKEVFLGKETNIEAAYAYGLTKVDSGGIYLTDSRIVFEGLDKKMTIKLDKILRIKTFSDGIEIMRETGKNPILHFPERADEFGIILNRLLRNR